jgi:taurine dioxygenase
MMILSNMRKDGKQIGANDAGQGWHTDMSYSRDTPTFCTRSTCR